MKRPVFSDYIFPSVLDLIAILFPYSMHRWGRLFFALNSLSVSINVVEDFHLFVEESVYMLLKINLELKPEHQVHFASELHLTHTPYNDESGFGSIAVHQVYLEIALL